MRARCRAMSAAAHKLRIEPSRWPVLALTCIMGSLVWPSNAQQPSTRAGAPRMYAFPDGVQKAVSTANDQVQAHVLQGWNHLHSAWDSEAHRHFSYAVQLDADCLMAQTGLAMSLLNCEMDQLAERNQAIERCVSLVEQGAGTDIERGYAYALSTIIQKNANAAAQVFSTISRRYPADVQAKLLEAALRRRGYNDLQQPEPEQQRAEQILQELRNQQPNARLFQHAWLNLRSDSPAPEKDLALANQLAQQQADYPAVHQLLGHYLWRCGDFAKANLAFGRASNLYGNWMKSNRLQPVDCPEWIRSEIYRAVALASAEDNDSALAIAEALAAIQVSSDRAGTASGRLLLWEAKSLPARILMSRGNDADWQAALKALPAAEAINALSDVSTVGAFHQGLMLLIEGRLALQHQDLSRAQQRCDQLGALIEGIDQKQEKITKLRERRWIEPARVYLLGQWNVLRGRLALAGPEAQRSMAYHHFSRACELPQPITFLMPPLRWNSLEVERAKYYLAMQRPDEALAVALDASAQQPNDLPLLRLIESLQLSQKKDAAATQAKINALLAR